jgi:hypothetical protein
MTMHSKLNTNKKFYKECPTYSSVCWHTYIQAHTVCARVCVHPLQILNHATNFHKSWYDCYATES